MALRDLGSLLRAAVRLDRTQSDPRVAARNAVGIAAPLVIAALVSTASAGLAPTIGALQTGLADRPGPYRLRALRMLGTAFAAALTSTLAILASRSVAASVVLLLALAFAAGLLVTGGPSATQVGVAGTAAALILGHLPQPPSVALRVGLLVLAGGAGQALLAIAAWPLGRHQPERLALARLYRELADEARSPGGPGAGPPATASVGTVRDTLYGLGHDHGPSVEAYRVLLDEAERIRREIGVIAALVDRLAREGAGEVAGLARTALASCGGVLDEVAAALQAARPVARSGLEPARQAVREAVTGLDGSDELTHRALAARLRALAGQLRAVLETSTTGASEGRRPEAADLRGGPSPRDPIAVVRANLSPDSEVLRHAVRLAVLVAGSDLVVRLAGFTHGYWVSLTVLVVLRPDFASTFQRAVLRVVGTVAGLVLATALLHWITVTIPSNTTSTIASNDWYGIALIALYYFGMRLAGPGNLLLTAVSLSGLVVVLLALDGVPPRQTLVERSVATAVGGALALVAVLLFPVWERTRVPDRLADLLRAYRRYLDVLADPGSGLAARQHARAGARRARTNAAASVDRARAEPVVSRRAVELGESVLANSHRIVHALMTIDAVRPSVLRRGRLPELAALLTAAAAGLDACETALRTQAVPRALPALRARQEGLHALLRAEPDRAGGLEAAGALADASDRLVNAVDTLTVQLRRNLATPDAGADTGRSGQVPSQRGNLR